MKLLLLLLLTTSALAAIKPDATNTGYGKTILKPTSGMTITKDGTVLDGLLITGAVKIKANNVTIKNCKIQKGSPYAINASFGYKNLVIQNTELDGSGASSALLYGGNLTADKLYIHSSAGDGAKAQSNFTLTNSYVHNLGASKGAHADATQITGGNHFKFIGNNFYMPLSAPAPYKCNAALFVQSSNGSIDDLVVDSNWMDGGNYSIQVVNSGKGNPTHVTISNNIFAGSADKKGKPTNFRYGVKRFTGPVTWTNNTWGATGVVIP